MNENIDSKALLYNGICEAFTLWYTSFVVLVLQNIERKMCLALRTNITLFSKAVYVNIHLMTLVNRLVMFEFVMWMNTYASLDFLFPYVSVIFSCFMTNKEIKSFCILAKKSAVIISKPHSCFHSVIFLFFFRVLFVKISRNLCNHTPCFPIVLCPENRVLYFCNKSRWCKRRSKHLQVK